MKKLSLDKKQIIILLLAALTPVIGCFLYALCKGMWLWEVSPLTSFWNDEVANTQTIKALIAYNRPLGAMGYNESIAQVGTMGQWTIFNMYPFVIVGKIFGFSYTMPIVTNIVVSTIALIAFVLIVKPDIKQMLWLVAAYLTFSMVSRYAFAILPESIICSFSLLCLTFLIGYIRADGREQYIYFALFEFFMVWLVLMRGYYAVLGLVLLYFSFKKKSPKILYLLQIILLALSMLVFLYILQYRIAPYFTDSTNYDVLSQLFTSPAEGITALFSRIYGNWLETLGYIKAAFTFESMRGSWWFLFFLVTAWFIYKAIKEKSFDYLVAVLTYFILLMAQYVLYNALEGCRQVMAAEFVGLLFIAYKEDKKTIKIVCLIAAIYMTWLSTETHYVSCPKYSEQVEASLLDGDKQLTQAMELTDDVWDNTVILPLTINWDDVYAIPAGFGLSICYDSYIVEHADDLMCRYVLAYADSEIDLLAQKKGWQLLATYSTSKMYQTR